MIKVGFIENSKKFTALEIFNAICITEDLGILSSKIKNKDLSDPYYENKKSNIIVLDSCENLKNENINQFLKECTYKNSILVLNVDDKENLKLLKGVSLRVITYGLDSKSSITASSIQKIEGFDEIQYCIQRAIPTLLGDIIEQQEFKVSIEKYKNSDTSKILAAISVALIGGLEIKNFEKIIL